MLHEKKSLSELFEDRAALAKKYPTVEQFLFSSERALFMEDNRDCLRSRDSDASNAWYAPNAYFCHQRNGTVCRHFNSVSGCNSGRSCNYVHICYVCNSESHGSEMTNAKNGKLACDANSRYRQEMQKLKAYFVDWSRNDVDAFVLRERAKAMTHCRTSKLGGATKKVAKRDVERAIEFQNDPWLKLQRLREASIPMLQKILSRSEFITVWRSNKDRASDDPTQDFDYGHLMFTLKNAAYPSENMPVMWKNVELSAETSSLFASWIELLSGGKKCAVAWLEGVLQMDLEYLKWNFRISSSVEVVQLLLRQKATNVPASLVGSLLLGLVRKAPAHGSHLQLGMSLSASLAYVHFCSSLNSDFIGSDPMRNSKVAVSASVKSTFGRPLDWLHALMQLATPAFQEIAYLLNDSASFSGCHDVDALLYCGIFQRCPPHWTFECSDSIVSFRTLASSHGGSSVTCWLQHMFRGIRSLEENVLDKEWWNFLRRQEKRSCEWPEHPSARLACIFLQCLMRINLVHESYLDPKWKAWCSSAQLVTFCMDLAVEFLLSFLLKIDASESYKRSIKKVQGLRDAYKFRLKDVK
jgi:hypothetical protein